MDGIHSEHIEISDDIEMPSPKRALFIASTLMIVGLILIAFLLVVLVRGFDSVTNKAVQSVGGAVTGDDSGESNTDDVPKLPGL